MVEVILVIEKLAEAVVRQLGCAKQKYRVLPVMVRVVGADQNRDAACQEPPEDQHNCYGEEFRVHVRWYWANVALSEILGGAATRACAP